MTCDTNLRVAGIRVIKPSGARWTALSSQESLASATRERGLGVSLKARINACARCWKTWVSEVLPSQLLLTKGMPPSGHPFNAGHPAPSSTCREGLTTLPGHGQRVDL